MKNIKTAVLGTTAFLFIFSLMPTMGVAMNLIFLMFLVGNGLVLYMVYVVLKHGVAPKETFEEGYWYSDVKKKFEQEV